MQDCGSVCCDNCIKVITFRYFQDNWKFLFGLFGVFLRISHTKYDFYHKYLIPFVIIYRSWEKLAFSLWNVVEIYGTIVLHSGPCHCLDMMWDWKSEIFKVPQQWCLYSIVRAAFSNVFLTILYKWLTGLRKWFLGLQQFILSTCVFWC